MDLAVSHLESMHWTFSPFEGSLNGLVACRDGKERCVQVFEGAALGEDRYPISLFKSALEAGGVSISSLAAARSVLVMFTTESG